MKKVELSKPSDYPRTYKVPTWEGIRKLILIILLFLGISFAYGHLGIHIYPLWLTALFISLFVILVLMFIDRIFTRVILYANHLECTSPLGLSKKVLYRDKIRGFSELSNLYGVKTSVLLYEDNARSSLYKIKGFMPFIIPTGLAKDAVWDEWMAIAPYLDLEK